MIFVRRAKLKKLSIWSISVITCIVLLILPFFANMVEYRVFGKRFNEQISERNNLALSSMCDKIDEQLVFAETLCSNIFLNEKVNKIIREVALPLDARDRFTLYKFISSFDFGYMQVDYQSGIYIYFEHIDTVARKGSSQSVKSFCQTFVPPEAADKTAEILRAKNAGEYVLMDFNGKKNELFYVKSMPGTEESKTVNIVLHIDKDAIAHDIKSLYLSQNGALVAVDENNRTLLSVRGNEKITDNVLSLEKDKSMLLYSVTSDTTGWRYVYALPRAEAYKTLNHSKTLMIFLLLSVFLLCVCMGVAFFRRNYYGINNLMRLFANEKKNIDEYSFLKEKIESILSENKKFGETLSGQNSYLKESVLTALLEGRELSGEYVKHETEKLDFDFGKDCFVAAMFSFDCENPEDYPREFVVENIFSELTERRGMRRHSLMYKGFLVYIIAFGDDTMLEKTAEDMRYMRDFIRENFGFRFLGAASGVRKNKSGIAAAFKEAQKTIKWQTILQTADIALFDEVNAEFKKNYFYTKKTEEKIVSLIRVNDKAQLHRELMQILKENRLLSDNTGALRYFVTEVYATINGLLAANGANTESFFPDECRLAQNVFECDDARKLRAAALSLVESCYDRVFAELNPVLDLTDKIERFIDENYKNQALSIQMIADEFKKSSDYVARQFRTKKEMRINDYINIVRINEAKKRLGETNELISTISEKVGFTNYRTFVRVFTSIAGVSPKHYRDTNIT